VTREEVEQMVAAEAQARAVAVQNAQDTMANAFGTFLTAHENSASPHGAAKFVNVKGTSDQFGIFNQATDPATAADPNDLWAQ
jgi:hypothetical protein